MQFLAAGYINSDSINSLPIHQHQNITIITINNAHITVIVASILYFYLYLIVNKNLHHLVKDVVAALHFLLKSDSGFLKQIRLNVATEIIQVKCQKDEHHLRKSNSFFTQCKCAQSFAKMKSYPASLPFVLKWMRMNLP